jgi:hypothetical protein
MRARVTIASLAATASAIALAACGSTTVKTDTDTASTGSEASVSTATSSPTSATASTATSTSTTATDTTTTTATDTTTTTATDTTTTPAATTGQPPCTAGMLRLSYLGGQGATGHGEIGFSLTNAGDHACHTFGYPGVLFLDAKGAALPTVPTHATQDFFGKVPETSLVVPPGGSVSFRLGVTHGINSTAGCATAQGLQVIPPDDTHTLRTTIGNGGAYECRTVTVSPLESGTSAYP